MFNFLGLGIDTTSRTIFVPTDKVRELLAKLDRLIMSNKVAIKEMQSLAGSLAFVVKASSAGRAFCSRIYKYGSMAGVKKCYYLLRVSEGGEV